MTPAYYLGNSLEMRADKTLKVSLNKYVKEVISRFERKNGTIRKENVPHSANDHLETDDSPYMNSEGITKFQSVMGIC